VKVDNVAVAYAKLTEAIKADLIQEIAEHPENFPVLARPNYRLSVNDGCMVLIHTVCGHVVRDGFFTVYLEYLDEIADRHQCPSE
jgi:hypothetical protein